MYSDAFLRSSEIRHKLFKVEDLAHSEEHFFLRPGSHVSSGTHSRTVLVSQEHPKSESLKSAQLEHSAT